MLVDLRMAKAQTEYKREQLSRSFPKTPRESAGKATAIQRKRGRGGVLRLRRVWSA